MARSGLIDFSKLSGGLLLTRGLLPYFVLKLLDERAPLCGTELLDAIYDLTGGRWRPSPGAMYPLLRRLRRQGLVKATPARRGGRLVQEYALTSEGRAELRRFLHEIRPRLEQTVALLQVHLHSLGGTWDDRAGHNAPGPGRDSGPGGGTRTAAR
ncbi:PadR family transcriptional regulator [Carboxydochorda subterranea]|uniref:PadR family transcriptional regulator n=1 Tax=Carboxydichorda subterranea TaxID=3109565 RepID=A0ABZ1BXA1_9FIRM|nr:PadR family transcriptional regulator [Limnochorda sp. L945t]WRP17424.1 PadR family transcriptional regulator [Limnochorda sp. L945t]